MSRANRAIAATVAGVGICLAAFASPAAAAPREFFGIAAGGQPTSNGDARKMGSTGVRTFRLVIDWREVQPSRPPAPLNFNGIDRRVGRLAAQGIRPVALLYGSPRWVSARPNRPPLGGSKQRRWRNFLIQVVNRYEPGGDFWAPGGAYQVEHPGASPKPITAWQIWNEPNLPKYFVRKRSTRKYGKLVKISSNAITAANPRAKVVLAGLTGFARPTGWAFLDRLYNVRRIKKHFDAVALHPYAATIGQFGFELRRIRGVMRRNRDRNTALWLTEVGWGSAQGTRRFPLNKGRQGQKRMLRRSFKLVLRKRRAWRIQRLFWFDWRDPPRGADSNCSFCGSAGLLQHNRRPKPAYRAFRSFAR